MSNPDLREEATDIVERLSDHPDISVEAVQERLAELVDLGVPLDGARDNVIREYTGEYEDVRFESTSREHDLAAEARAIHDELRDPGDVTVEMVHEMLQKRVVEEGMPLETARADLIEQTNRLVERRRKRGE